MIFIECSTCSARVIPSRRRIRRSTRRVSCRSFASSTTRLDAAVFAAYGWDPSLTDEEILARVVAPNAERAAEESRGVIRWLRPGFQNPAGAKAATQETMDLGDEPDEAAVVPAAKPVGAWPKKPSEQFAAVRDLLSARPTAWSEGQVRAAFKGAPADDVAEMMATLVVSGQAVASRRPTDRAGSGRGEV
ncbi:MAG: hypothetical protein IPN17_23735 [Deltaproteobacteria bacterium]|nr:hypothetical protein [Deltaproteobacteria bacterium]